MISPRTLYRSSRTAATFAALLLTVPQVLGCGDTPEKGGRVKSPGIIKSLDEGGGGTVQIVPIGNVPQNVASITARVLKMASKARKLKVKEPVKLSVLSPQEIVNIVRKKVAVDIPKELIRGEGRTYALLGLIPPDYDYEAETYALLEEELAGLYIPEDKTMYISKSVDQEELHTTLAHELVHALQDQYFDIGTRMKFKPGESDAIAAVHALAEGDATSAMIDVGILDELGEDGLQKKGAYMLPDRDPEDFLALQKQKPGSKIAKAPRFLAVGLLAPYADGMRFVHELRRHGGWKAVDAAWARPPSSTEQLLHMEKYEANEPSVEVPAATGLALGPSWKKTYDDIFGEQEGRIAFSEWMDMKTSKKAAGGWGGDHVTLFEDGDKRALVWKIVFDDAKEASEALTAISYGWGRVYGIPSISQAPAEGEELHGWGPIPPPPPPKVDPKAEKAKQDEKAKKGEAATKPGDKKPGAKGPPPLPTLPGAPLPPLPDVPGGAPATMKPTTTCRVLRLSGKSVSILAHAPCATALAWAAEVGK